MKKRILAIIMAVSALLCSCGTATEKEAVPYDEPLVFTDSTGYTVTLTEYPQRVAILFSSYADIWVSAGGIVDITVGESVKRGFAAEDAVLVDEGSGHSDIDLEALMAAEPDLVIGTADYEGQCEAAEFCRENGIPAALFTEESVDDYLAILKIFTDITGQSEVYTTLGTDVKARIDSLLNHLKDAGYEQKSILFIRAGSSASSTKAKGTDDHFAGRMLAQIGCINIADSAPVLLDGLSLEAVLAADPDHIFISAMGDADAAEEYINGIFAEDGWSSLTAVKEGNYTLLPKNMFHYKPNSLYAQAYDYLVDALYY